MKLLSILTITMLLSVVMAADMLSAEEYRVRGGKADDYTDSQGRVWRGAQQADQAWGGWIETEPRTAEVAELTSDAQAQAAEAGYDAELFYAVSWAQYPTTIKYQLKTGNGTFDVTYLVGEHWSPNNRGFDIIIEDEIVEALYVTPGNHEIDIKTYDTIVVADGTLDLEFAGNPDAGTTDRNATFSGLEVIESVSTAVDPKEKLTTTWGTLKNIRQ